jgi:thioredoxin-related protein
MTEIAQKNQIRSLPTLMFYKNGENVETKKGFVSKIQLIEIIENL